MATTTFTAFFASTLVSNNKASSGPLPLELGPRFVFFRKPSLKVPSSKPWGMVVKAQQGGSPEKKDSPMSPEQFRKNVAPIKTTPYGNDSTPSTALLPYIVRKPWSMMENDQEIEMGFEMPGLVAESIEVEVVDDMLVIKVGGGVDASGNKILSPYEIQPLPSNSRKEEITAVYNKMNGVFYITVPKIVKSDHNVIHIPVKSVY